MKTIRRWVQRLVEANVSLRTAVLLAVCSTVLLLGMMTLWLGMSTRTALLDKQLEDLDSTQTALTDEINQTWTQIGELTSPRMMEPRARQLGYAPAEQIEYLIVTPAVTPTLTTTVAITTTEVVTPAEPLTATTTVTP